MLQPSEDLEMGCWAIDSFGNDDAADWIAELTEQDDWTPVDQALTTVVETIEYVEAPEAAEGLAAAEVVAAALGRPGPAATANPALVKWLDRTQPRPSRQQVETAAKAVARVLAEDSELRELWAETSDFDAWRTDVEGLLARLNV
ncbi:DUF4259 domain-containing protein [Aquabacterium sp. A7-Y]|uniref:DUF4259 domain-containing protein n=1 Tax=Aquabacterium sp. A7-Y TaxID=1349605 RepID=UPI00223D969B|nr:DUF4259 domain-containing protein [Aquabacterium sp. A7-Y]MCW7539770.1 DUF4259 domain-containing protein [Aquabacterium sp. A7-Y]